jgi:hypothetical protein
MNALTGDKSKVSVGGVKYKRVSSSADSYIATADDNKGHLLIVKIDEAAWAIAFAAHHAVPELSIIDVMKAAIQLINHV